MFLKRVISAIIFGAIVIFIVLDGTWLFFAVVSLVIVLGSIEFSKLAKSNLVLKFLIIFFAWLICLSSFKPEWLDINLIIFLSICLPFLIEILRRKPDSAFFNVSSVLLGIFYIGWLFGRHLILLRQMPDGRNLIFLLAGITWSGDIGAYLIGMFFGKHKIIPAISPGKSLEGYIAGIVLSCITALIISHFLLPEIWIVHIIILGIGLTIIGQIGDLAESMLKRSAKVKDSGKLMPGHGGILDRCDSMMFITPALYYYALYLIY
jgi:phosphatidate cytidylyltransferase